MSTVTVHLDACLGIILAVGVTPDVMAAVDHRNLESELPGCALGHCKAEEAGSDDDEISVHKFSCNRGTPMPQAPAFLRSKTTRRR
jgi:hypothetical protein